MRGTKERNGISDCGKLQEMQRHMEELAGQIKGEKPEGTTEEISALQSSNEDMLKAILWMLDGANPPL